MKKVVLLIFLILVISAYGFSETGIGLSAYYPVWCYYSPDNVEFDDFMFGVNLRSKHSLFLLDVSAHIPLSLSTLVLPIDVGICFDLFIFRIAVLGGVTTSYCFMYDSFDESFGWMPNVKANVDVKLGKFTVGLSGTYGIPIDAVGDSKENWLYYTGVSLNALYWFD